MNERWTFEGKIYEWDDNQFDCPLNTEEKFRESRFCGECSHRASFPRCGGWQLLDPRILELEAERKKLREALKDRISFYYTRDVPHQRDVDRCMCRDCIDKRVDSALSEKEKP